jgi:integrase
VTAGGFCGPLASEFAAFAATLEASASANKTTLTQLRALDRFTQQHGLPSGTIDETLARAWLAGCESRGPNTRRARYYLLRRFCRHLSKRRPDTFIPGESLRPRGRPPKRPHIYSREEIRRLLDGALTLRDWTRGHPCPIRSKTMRTIILLLVTSGLRISEALHLSLQDVDLAAGVLSVRQSKFRKSRLVPVSAGTLEELRRNHDLRLTVALPIPAKPSSSPAAAPPTARPPCRRCSATSPSSPDCGDRTGAVPGYTTYGQHSPSPACCSGTATARTSWPACRC